MKWEMKIELHSYSFESLQSLCSEIVERVAKAKSYKELPRWGAINSSSGGSRQSSYSVSYKCPDELRIIELRKEADALEAKLNGETT